MSCRSQVNPRIFPIDGALPRGEIQVLQEFIAISAHMADDPETYHGPSSDQPLTVHCLVERFPKVSFPTDEIYGTISSWPKKGANNVSCMRARRRRAKPS